MLDHVRLRLLTDGLRCRLLPRPGRRRDRRLPASSEVLRLQLRQSGLPHWTAWYVPCCQVRDDLWGRSHFNFEVDGDNYHVLRTGAFPFVKFHCTKRDPADLDLEDRLYTALKVANLGIPTLLYGLAGLALARHTETVRTPKGEVTLYFWYREDRGSRF